MKQAVLRYIVTFLMFMALFIIEKPIFMLVYSSLYPGIGIGDVFSVIWHGLLIDASVSGYLTVIPALLILVMLLVRSRVTDIIARIYFIIVSLLLAAIFVGDTVLYGYWGFKLDATPLFYFASSPSAAMASVSTWQVIGGVMLWLVVAALFYTAFYFTSLRIKVSPLSKKRKPWGVALGLFMTALLFLPIRGGVTVSTMNVSYAYFSQNQRLNHAAVNPAFSLLYSLNQQKDFSKQFRYFDNDEATRIAAELTDTRFTGDTTLLNTDRPDVWIIIAESFSAHLMPSLGGEPIAVKLDSIARSGLLFTNFYASSFRTDRSLPAILSGFPGQPNTSVMKYVKKAEHLPSIPQSLRKAGYDCAYYYGGDVNFTNMLAYLVNCGFSHIVSDKDFSISEKASKWGAHDHTLFAHVIAENAADTVAGPRFRVVQTSSSHEPFEVPFHSNFTDKRLNAFAYSDNAIATFVNSLATSPRWDRTLVVIVPDHYGVYPDNLTDPQSRHRVPLIMTGGALKRRGTIATVGDQTDIAATLLDALAIQHRDFKFSTNLMDSVAPHYAFFTSPSDFGLVSATDTVTYSIESDQPIKMQGRNPGKALDRAKAYLQKIYDAMSDL